MERAGASLRVVMRKRSTLEAGFGTEKSSTDEGSRTTRARPTRSSRRAVERLVARSDLPAHVRCSIGVMSQTIAGARRALRRRDALDEAVDDAEAKVEHCGWLAEPGRAVLNWKMRWVLLQAGSLWYFKDQTLKEQLGRMPLARAQARSGATEACSTRLDEQRTLHLRAADRTEALACRRVLRRALAELAPAQSAERVLVDGVVRGGARSTEGNDGNDATSRLTSIDGVPAVAATVGAPRRARERRGARRDAGERRARAPGRRRRRLESVSRRDSRRRRRRV